MYDALDTNVERLLVLETNVDDLSPQVMAYAMEEIISAGALDAWCAPVLMKKGRQGTMLGVLCEPRLADTLIRIILTVRITVLCAPPGVTRIYVDTSCNAGDNKSWSTSAGL